MKNFFSIAQPHYSFEIFDVTALFTLLNVVLIIQGVWFAPVFGLVNCAIIIILNIKNHAHINAYITQFSLIALNIYFLI